MINLITAIGNQYINERIKNIEKCNVFLKDIQYPEGILEILHIHQNIEILLISTSVLREKEFLEKIREEFENLEIIIFMDKKSEMDVAYFNSKGIYKIYYNNENGYEECLRFFRGNQKNITEQVRNDMKQLKEAIIEKQNRKIEKNNFFMMKKEKNTYLPKSTFPRIVLIAGNRGVREKCFFYCIF